MQTKNFENTSCLFGVKLNRLNKCNDLFRTETLKMEP